MIIKILSIIGKTRPKTNSKKLCYLLFDFFLSLCFSLFPLKSMGVLIRSKSMGAESDLLLAHCYGPYGNRKFDFGARNINWGKIFWNRFNGLCSMFSFRKSLNKTSLELHQMVWLLQYDFWQRSELGSENICRDCQTAGRLR